ncbi:LamG domain-containing protein [Mucilaginibacter hurinus]|uniref:LamG domain-containing protein n=1 Tax=Mucilaginibacter hurinus TaxID=2201324 RepID=A0A367GPP0_9SPHI|nr:LamG-like jellyroll fold domain-containing protein [Mucilaginibacter hurinus]RCH55429.1 LamG domain-containing protein [Mucilaginibacter hurinus]
MKKILKYITMASIIIGASSCQKDFDPSTYAPPLNIGGFTSADEVATSNLIGYWGFNGDLKDAASGSDGVNTGTSFSTGVKGEAMQGALDSYVIADPSSSITGMKSFTITEWINTAPPTTGIIGIFSLAKTTAFWGNIEIFIENGSTNDDGKLRIHIAKGAADNTIEVNGVKNLFNGWINLAVSYNEETSEYKVYIAGSRVAAGTLAGLTGPLDFQDIGNLVFGCVQFQTEPSQTTATGKQGWASYLTGRLDEVRIYNKALSDVEVGAIVKLEGRGK